MIYLMIGNSMARRENMVERYLDSEILKLGGMTRKWVSPGVNGVPDRIVIIQGLVFFVEVKTVDGRLSPWQERELERLSAHGAHTDVVYGVEGVDKFIQEVRELL
jgi:hypothetical protein|tara:strand:+ start:686 stop:1000 length:315 start_codon:yes stop_codon:yes gene_type:complete